MTRGSMASSSRTRTMPPIARWKLLMCRERRSSGMRSMAVYRNTRKTPPTVIAPERWS